MIEVKYGYLSEKSFKRYFEFLVGRVYKILPMREEDCDTLKDYIKGLQIELLGSSQLYEVLIEEPKFISLLNIIQYLISSEYDISTCKQEVFKAIKLINEINKKYFKGAD